jgi:hypothetical protein
MDSGRLYIIGVIHRDKKGPDLLSRWLDRIRPDVITLELSRFGLSLRQERGEEYKARIGQVLTSMRERNVPWNQDALSLLQSYVDPPYEFQVASAYKAAHEIPLYLIDMDMFSYLRLRSIEELLSPENIENLLSDRHRPARPQEKVLADLFFTKGVKVLPYSDEMYIRDLYMSRKIGVLLRFHTGGRFLHVCGWQHLQDPHDLYTPFKPVKVFFYDKALCV